MWRWTSTPRMGKLSLRSRLHAVAATADEQRFGGEDAGIGGAPVGGHVDVGCGGRGTEETNNILLLVEAIEHELFCGSNAVDGERSVRMEVKLVTDRHGGGSLEFCNRGCLRTCSGDLSDKVNSIEHSGGRVARRDVARGRTALEADAHARGRCGCCVASRLVQVLVGRVVTAAIDGLRAGRQEGEGAVVSAVSRCLDTHIARCSRCVGVGNDKLVDRIVGGVGAGGGVTPPTMRSTNLSLPTPTHRL